MAEFWTIWVNGALRYPHVWMLDNAAAVSVWIPPGGTEVSDEQFEELRTLAERRLGPIGTKALIEVFDRFGRAHPQPEPHFYLSLLGTHPDWRGQGLGMRLLSANLAHADKEGVPTYLESSNPANDQRYQRVGYEPVVSFELPAGQRVTGMWRGVVIFDVDRARAYPECVRQLYLAATGMNRGKTTVALGLLAALLDRGLDTGFIKPVGQRYAIVDGEPADEDAILMRSALGLQDPLKMMSPVHIPRGFTKAYIRGEVTPDLAGRIRKSHSSVAQKHDLLLIEGTGHAGVGSVVGLSNAQVARMLRAPAAIVAEAGVGRPIDEIVLNRALFARHGVEVVGAIVNKVDADAHPTLPDVLRDGLASTASSCWGCCRTGRCCRTRRCRCSSSRSKRDSQPGRGPGPRHRARGDWRHAAAPFDGAHRPGIAAYSAQ